MKAESDLWGATGSSEHGPHSAASFFFRPRDAEGIRSDITIEEQAAMCSPDQLAQFVVGEDTLVAHVLETLDRLVRWERNMTQELSLEQEQRKKLSDELRELRETGQLRVDTETQKPCASERDACQLRSLLDREISSVRGRLDEVSDLWTTDLADLRTHVNRDFEDVRSRLGDLEHSLRLEATEVVTSGHQNEGHTSRSREPSRASSAEGRTLPSSSESRPRRTLTRKMPRQTSVATTPNVSSNQFLSSISPATLTLNSSPSASCGDESPEETQLASVSRIINPVQGESDSCVTPPGRGQAARGLQSLGAVVTQRTQSVNAPAGYEARSNHHAAAKLSVEPLVSERSGTSSVSSVAPQVRPVPMSVPHSGRAQGFSSESSPGEQPMTMLSRPRARPLIEQQAPQQPLPQPFRPTPRATLGAKQQPSPISRQSSTSSLHPRSVTVPPGTGVVRGPTAGVFPFVGNHVGSDLRESSLPRHALESPLTCRASRPTAVFQRTGHAPNSRNGALGPKSANRPCDTRSSSLPSQARKREAEFPCRSTVFPGG